uniref:Methyltransferase domain-containing protein n=1 Tax=Plectus sambesii TaxID=2011161 RepID=A0A914WVT2_9BILA
MTLASILMANRWMLTTVATVLLVVFCIIIWEPTTTNWTITRTAIGSQLSVMASAAGIKHPSLEQEFIKIDRSRFDPLVKAFFQQQQKARQITMQQNLDISHAAFHYLYNALMPEVNCPRLMRVGNTDDGGKWICDPWQLPDNCTVYSLGVGGDVTFEVELSNMTNLRCNTFSVNPDTKYASLVGTIPKVTFNAWRMAQVDKPAEKVRSIQGIMQEYGH